jgi:excisionase family DNA binding protein
MPIEDSPARGSHKQTFSTEIFLTEQETSEMLRVSQRTLQRWRMEGTQGLPFRRFGGLIRYALSDVEQWAAAQSRVSTSGAGE